MYQALVPLRAFRPSSAEDASADPAVSVKSCESLAALSKHEVGLKVVYGRLYTAISACEGGKLPLPYSRNIDESDVFIPQVVVDMHLGEAPSVEELIEREAPRPLEESDGYFVSPCGQIMCQTSEGVYEPVPLFAICNWSYYLICNIIEDTDNKCKINPIVTVFDTYIGIPRDNAVVVPLDMNPLNCRLDNLGLWKRAPSA